MLAMTLRSILLLLCMYSILRIAELAERMCASPQYLGVGIAGTVCCNFQTSLFAVLWYNETDFEAGTPTLRYQGNTKTGPGYESGEFDVHPNGSLVIKQVQLRHEGVFTVAYTQSKTDFYEFINVRVVVVVKPQIGFPIIDKCGEDKSKCYAETVDPDTQCLVRGARPNISLEIVARTIDGDKSIFNDLVIIPEDSVFTSSVTTNEVFHYSSLLILIVCKALSPLGGMLSANESSILMLNSDFDFTKVKSKSTYVTLKTRLELNCTENTVGFVVWKRTSSPHFTAQYLLLYSVFIGEGYMETFADDVTFENNASLIISSTEVKHEGLYFCIFGDGLKDGVSAYNVSVTVPAYPQIEGCIHHPGFALDAEYEGQLTCRVKGIRPQVQLRWKISSSEETALEFYKDKITVKEHDQYFDVTLISQYRVQDRSLENLIVECEVVHTAKIMFGLRMTVDLRFPKGKNVRMEPPTYSLPWIILSVVVLCLILLACGVLIKRCTDKRQLANTQTLKSQKEMTSSLDKNCTEAHNSLDMKQKFLNLLKEKYKDLYEAVQPIPYIKDRLFCVNSIFVEGGIEYLSSRRGGMKHWEGLYNYQNVFHDTMTKRHILEGGPGYGKSTIALQIVYDWCNPSESSPLKEVDVLILLRLRQLGGVMSIDRAIKRFILPKDSQLSETDVRNILQDSDSVLVILDGFDEYPDKDSNTSDVMSIIARQMFQSFHVVLTTRPPALPPSYPPTTKRLRLTGFDENARSHYIRKAVVGDDDKTVRKIERCLEENPILSDLCQVPLLFVIFAHMTYENENFRTLNSVTSFFRHIISCFHSHMRNKMKEENVRKYRLFETEHHDLDELAFKELNGPNPKLIWDKDEMCQEVGYEFYEQYLRIGILVEEEVAHIIDDPSAPITEHVQYKTRVRFHHKIFCEWYAAHYFTYYIEKNSNLDLSSHLQYLNPFDVEYLFRFSCGLSLSSSEKIINYLKNIEGGDKFAILCILEQTGSNDNIMETILQLCFEGILISGHDSLLLQRCSMQLLEIAARNDIPVKYVQLHNCFHSVDMSAAAIWTTSGLALTSRIPMEELGCPLYIRDRSEDKFKAILGFATNCSSLTYLWFDGSPPPRSFAVGPTLSKLSSRKVIEGR